MKIPPSPADFHSYHKPFQDVVVQQGSKARMEGATAPVSREQPLEHSFEYVTKYFKDALSLSELLSTQSRRTAQLDELVSHLSKGDWATIESNYSANMDDLALDALVLFRNGSITVGQLSTACFRYSLAKDFPGTEVRRYALFDDAGHVNPEARKYIKQTLSASGLVGEKLEEEGVNFSHLTEAELDHFFELMKQLPPSEQFFFAVPIEPFPDSAAYSEKDFDQSWTVMEQVYLVGGVNVFHRFHTQEGQSMRMIPSLGMMQSFLNAATPDRAVTITPRIGMSEIEDIYENGKKDMRDLGIPFPEIVPPLFADTYHVRSAADFFGHDFYHAIAASEIPINARRILVDFAESIRKLQVSYEEKSMTFAFLQILFEITVDMDYPFLRRVVDQTLPLKIKLINSVKELFEMTQSEINSPAGTVTHNLLIKPIEAVDKVAIERCKKALLTTLDEIIQFSNLQ